MLVKCQVNVKSQSELDIGGRETCTLSDIDVVILVIVKPWPQTLSLKTKTKGPLADTKILWANHIAGCATI